MQARGQREGNQPLDGHLRREGPGVEGEYGEQRGAGKGDKGVGKRENKRGH